MIRFTVEANNKEDLKHAVDYLHREENFQYYWLLPASAITDSEVKREGELYVQEVIWWKNEFTEPPEQERENVILSITLNRLKNLQKTLEDLRKEIIEGGKNDRGS